MARQLSFTAAIQEALKQCMARDAGVICFGLGVDDPRRIFGTTAGLQEAFGEERVFDTPTSENAMTGIGIGASLTGIKPVMVHQRMDFFLLAMEQLVNNEMALHAGWTGFGRRDHQADRRAGMGSGADAFTKPACLVCTHTRIARCDPHDAL